MHTKYVLNRIKLVFNNDSLNIKIKADTCMVINHWLI